MDRLLAITEKWISWPAAWEDQNLSVSQQVDELLDISFDPRDFIDYTSVTMEYK